MESEIPGWSELIVFISVFIFVLVCVFVFHPETADLISSYIKLSLIAH